MQPPEQLPSEETHRSVNPHIPPIRSSVPPASLRNLPLLGGHVPPASLSKLPLPRGMPLPPSGMPPFPRGMPPLPGGLPPLSSGNPGGRGINSPPTLAELVLGLPVRSLGNEVVEISIAANAEIGLDIVPSVSKDEIERLKDQLEQARTLLEISREASKLYKQAYVFSHPGSVETWATRWVASPIAHLFLEMRPDEWLNVLRESNYEMLKQGHHRWEINLNNTLLAISLIESALTMKLREWGSVLKNLW